MTETQLRLLATEPKAFLSQCKYHEKEIRLKQDEIQRYHDIATSITQEIKEVTTFSLTPSHKVEKACLEVVTLEGQIEKEIARLVESRQAIVEAIGLLTEQPHKLLLQARYLNQMTWEEIALMIPCSYRWTLRLHGIALRNLSQAAKEKLERSHVNSR